MDKLVWSNKIKIGVETIDLQHHYFLDLINRLIVYKEKGSRKLQPFNLLQEILYYAQFHFTSEENLMLEYDYPKYEAQREEHRKLIEHLLVEISKFENNEKDLDILYNYLTNWFYHHTIRDDKEMGIFISIEANKYQ